MNNAVCRAVCRTILIVFTALGVMAAVPAWAGVPFSAITVDARTGKVLFDQDSDGYRHPASLTKVMTLYLLFEEIKAGKYSLDSKLQISQRATTMAPSKLGLKAGSTITVENAIKALVTKSANDVAAAIAENLEGNEAAFAARMTKKAKALGMSRTTYKNASGLPNPLQVTTARDQATLGLRIQRDFPSLYPYFRIASFTYNGKSIRTHNRLLGKFKGTDGIKTGYIRASGFNLTTSAERDGRRIIGVVMGGSSGGSRDAYMRKMLDKHFPNCVKGNTIAALAGSSKGVLEIASGTASPDRFTESKQPAIAESAPAESAVTTASTEPQTIAGKILEEPKVIEANVTAPSGLDNPPFEVKLNAAGTWHIQIGAFPNKREAQKRLYMVRSSATVVKDKPAFTVTVQKGLETIYRARFSGFSEKTAKDACKALSQQSVSCLALPPQS